MRMDHVVSVPVEGNARGLPEVWSPTAVNDFLKCPLAYWWKYGQGWRTKPSVATASGSLVHDVLEALIGMPPSERSIDTAREVFRGLFTARNEAGDYRDVATEVWARAGAAMAAYFALEDPAAVEPIDGGLEMAVSGVVDGVPVAGRADRVEFGVGGARVVDYKTGAARPAYAVGYWRQQLVYARLLAESGITTTEVELLYLGAPGGRLRRPVPPAAVQRVSADVARCAEQRAESEVAGRWEARPQALCSYCPFRWACPARVAGPVPLPGSPESDARLARNRDLIRRVAARDEVDRVGNPEEGS
jgi:putative RecB family exonuclease